MVGRLFEQGQLYDYLRSLVLAAQRHIEELGEDEILQRSADDLLEEAVQLASCGTLRLRTDSWLSGDIEEVRGAYPGGRGYPTARQGVRVWAEYEWSGNRDLFRFTPSERLLVVLEADVRPDSVMIEHALWGRSVVDVTPDMAKVPLDQAIGRIAIMIDNANKDALLHNSRIADGLRPTIESRRDRLLAKRNLQGQLGFPLSRQPNPPRPVPLERKVLGIERRRSEDSPRTYEDEYALNDADYEDVLSVLVGMLRGIERSPSVASSRDEESLRDILLVALNGTFKGAATGETFVKSGKTDILVRVEDRHVFVGECKWWDGPQTLKQATDQLLGYMPWRDEKAALILFIDRVDTSAVLEKANEAIQQHLNCKRLGKTTHDPSLRMNYVFGHPGDADREIHVAVLYCVIR